jgi:polyhydroxyalkanoate synthesis regulator phasin
MKSTKTEAEMTTDNKQTNEKHTPLYELARKMMLASIGATVVAQEEIENFIDRLAERGELAEKDARQLMHEMRDRREKIMKEREAKARPQTAGVTKADIDALNNRIAELTKLVEQLKAAK